MIDGVNLEIIKLGIGGDKNRHYSENSPDYFWNPRDFLKSLSIEPIFGVNSLMYSGLSPCEPDGCGKAITLQRSNA